MSGGLIAALMFPALFLFIFLGMPVSFSLAAVALLFGIGTFGEAIGSIFFDRLLGISTASMLAAVPLFIFMGAMLERSAIAERLFRVMQIWLGFLPGGLAIASHRDECRVRGAATGIIGAVEAVIGMMAIPAMMKLGYDKGLISGTICGRRLARDHHPAFDRRHYLRVARRAFDRANCSRASSFPAG